MTKLLFLVLLFLFLVFISPSSALSGSLRFASFLCALCELCVERSLFHGLQAESVTMKLTP